MFTIGEFARLGSVTVRALRHYDQIDLLGPTRIDESTGYRYYAVAQLAPLNRIVALQRLGFSLKEIENLLGDAVTSLPEPAGIYELDPVEESLSLVREIEDLDGYSDAYQDLAVWAETNGYVLVGYGRDLSLDGNGEGTGLVMETQWPLRRPDAPIPVVVPRRIG